MLQQEQDASCKRNAFLMLFHCCSERAVAYLSENLEQVAGWGDIMQLVVLELIRKIVRANPCAQSRHDRPLLGASSPARPSPPSRRYAKSRYILSLIHI